MKTFKERFADVWSELGDCEQIAIYNEWAYRIGEEPIEDMDLFDDVMCGWKPIDIALRIRFGDFNPNHNYFRFDGYGNLESTDYPVEWIEDYMDDFVGWYEENEDVLTCVCSEMEDILEDEDEDESETEE